MYRSRSISYLRSKRKENKNIYLWNLLVIISFIIFYLMLAITTSRTLSVNMAILSLPVWLPALVKYLFFIAWWINVWALPALEMDATGCLLEMSRESHVTGNLCARTEFCLFIRISYRVLFVFIRATLQAWTLLLWIQSPWRAGWNWDEYVPKDSGAWPEASRCYSRSRKGGKPLGSSVSKTRCPAS